MNKKRNTWILIAVAINLLLLPFTLQKPPTATAQVTKAWMFDCCRDWSDGRRLCCYRCCWWPKYCPRGGCEQTQ